MSVTFTKTATFTIVHARYLASKVAADMHLCAAYYGKPSEQQIRDYAEEFAQFLNEGYLVKYEFGFKKDGLRIVSWRFTVDSDGNVRADDRPGKVVPYVDIAGAAFFTFLTWNSNFSGLSQVERERFTGTLPVRRTTGGPPSDGDGYWVSDRNYHSGGCSVGRQTFRPF